MLVLRAEIYWYDWLYIQSAKAEYCKIWSLETFELLSRIHAHRGSVLCLYLSADGKLLFSSAGDAIVNVGKPIS